jgi:hypothetical protein
LKSSEREVVIPGKKPKRAEPSTWAQTILGAMGLWAMMALGYGTIPHEWLTFGGAYLNFNTATYVMRLALMPPSRGALSEKFLP